MNKKLQIKPDTYAFTALSQEKTYKGQKQRVDICIDDIENLIMIEHDRYMEKVAYWCNALKDLKMVSNELSYRNKPITREEY